MESLDQFVASGRTRFRRRFILPADAGWFAFIHKRPPGAASLLFDQLSAHFDRLATKTDKRDPVVDIWQIAASTVINSQPGVFMAPMCSPLTRSAAAPLASAADGNSYWITEKSDGLRVVVVSIMTVFPRWSRGPSVTPSPLGEGLYDTAQLERGFYELFSDPTRLESSHLRLTFGVHTLKRLDASTSSDAHKMEQFLLCRKIDAAAAAAGRTEEHHLPVSRECTPRHFTYLFDRAMDATYLLLDEYVFSTASLVVLDGELMCTVLAIESSSPSQRAEVPVIGFFDLFAYAPMPPDGNALQLTLAASRERLTLLQRHTMSSRYQLLRERIFTKDFHALAQACRTTTVIQMFCKRMYAVTEVLQLIAQMKRASSGGDHCEYIFCGGPFGPTRNDGLIFTPENFDIVAGSCETQLKWKYPTMLTVDWLLETKGQPPDPNDPRFNGKQMDLRQRFRYCMYFKKRMRPGEPELFGHSEFSRSLPLTAPASETLPVVPFVAECRYDPASASWCYEKIRREKKDANSVVTVVSVLEAQCERIALRSLLDMLGTDCSTADPNSIIFAEGNQANVPDGEVVESGEASGIERPLPPVTHFIVRATNSERSQTIELTLQFLVKLPDHRNALICNHRRVTQCYGLGEPCPEEDPTSQLVPKMMIALANGGGSFAWSEMVCDAIFDASRGRWAILALHPKSDKNMAYCTRTIQYLMDYATHEARGGTRRVPASALAVTGADRRDASASMVAGGIASTDQHYADRTRALGHDANRSNLRLHNNWIKSLLIEMAVSIVSAERMSQNRSKKPLIGGISSQTQQQQQQLAVLDLCCGRGGDLHKWRQHKPKRLLMVDSCMEAVSEAAARYAITPGLSTMIDKDKPAYPGVPAMFHVQDCFSTDLWTHVLAPDVERKDGGLFDIASCQFSMHYAFCSEQKVRSFVSNVAQSLTPGGIFVGTTVHDGELLRRRALAMAAHAPAADLSAPLPSAVEFGNSVYHVTFPSPPLASSPRSPLTTSARITGDAYTIRLEESVADAEEYVVPWNAFVKLCSEPEYKLKLLESDNFEQISKRHENTDLGQRVMSIITASGKRERGADAAAPPTEGASHVSRRFALTADEAETAKLFRGFLFQKTA